MTQLIDFITIAYQQIWAISNVMTLLFGVISCYFAFKYKYLANHDYLTSLLSRREFEKRLVKRMKFIKKYSQYAMFYYLIDLDDFKKINDTKGHKEGDKILRAVSRALKKSIRTKINLFSWLKKDKRKISPIFYPDIIGRWGGEEFCIAILIHKHHILDHNIGDKALETSIGERLNHIAVKNGCSISIGISTYISQMPIHVEKITKRADNALYQAKKLGKNRTVRFV